MKMPLQAVLFDLDGTLLDTAPDLWAVTNQLCRNHRRPELDYATTRNRVSHGARALVQLAFESDYEQLSDDTLESLRQELLSLYQQRLAVSTTLFPGLEQLLQWLEQQQLPWGIVTNKPRIYSEGVLEALELDQRCSVLVCPDDVSNSKPDPEPMLLACKQIDCKPALTLYIGDHRRDIEAGQNSGMPTLAAGYGYISEDDPAADWNADYIVEQPEQILPLIQRHYRQPSS